MASSISRVSGVTATELGVAGTEDFRRGLNGISSELKLSARESDRRRGEILGILGLVGDRGDVEDTEAGI